MKNSLHASLRASGLDGAYGYQNNYHFPPVHTADFWREPVRDDLVVTGAGARGRARRPLTLPDLTHQVHRSTVYANNHARSRANGYEHKHKKMSQTNGEVATPKTPEDIQGCRLKSITSELPRMNGKLLNRPTGALYPELKVVVTKLIPREHVSSGAGEPGGEAGGRGGRARRVTHRKHAPDHT
ncbi:uncharacterized protein LOC119189331 [Manduca sexta]|nr:uncharacterized protein LOC119189331 [Manduca sexta]